MKLSLGISCLAAVADAWTYRNVSEWVNEAPLCNSSVPNQSPINVDTTNPGTTTNPLVFQGLPDSATTPEIKSQAEINNHTWEVAWDIDDMATEKYGVQYNGKVFRLNQIHLHSPSEHTIDGKHYDLEAHMVHSCYGNLTCVTQDPNDENLVVAIFMNVGEENAFLGSFWPKLEALAANASAPSIINDMANPYNALVPPQPHDFYRYIGSTTTPGCVQDVEWFLMSTPTTLSQAQLTTYRQAITAHNYTQTLRAAAAPEGVTVGWDVNLGTNNRPLQPILDRVPEKYTSPAEQAEEQRSFMWHGLLIFCAVVALAICCLVLFMRSTKPKEKKAEKVSKARGIKPKPKEEEIPLVAPQLVTPAPMLFTQPLQAPMTTFAAPQIQQVQLQQSFAPQRIMVAP